MKRKVSFVLEMFLTLLKESDLGFSVTVDGDLIFNDRITGEQLGIKAEDVAGYYDNIKEVK